MALLGGVLLDVVYADQPERSVRTTDHPLEDGESIVDHIEIEPVTIRINGVVTGPDAAARLSKLETFQRTGQLLTYTNRVKYENVVIERFGSDHGKQIANGFQFSISLKRVRTVKPSPIKGLSLPQRARSKPVTNAGRQQTQKQAPAPKIPAYKRQVLEL